MFLKIHSSVHLIILWQCQHPMVVTVVDAHPTLVLLHITFQQWLICDQWHKIIVIYKINAHDLLFILNRTSNSRHKPQRAALLNCCSRHPWAGMWTIGWTLPSLLCAWCSRIRWRGNCGWCPTPVGCQIALNVADHVPKIGCMLGNRIGCCNDTSTRIAGPRLFKCTGTVVAVLISACRFTFIQTQLRWIWTL